MSKMNGLPANFTISQPAKHILQDFMEAGSSRGSDAPVVVSVAWGHFAPTNGETFDNVFVSFYVRSQLSEVAPAIEKVSGLDVIFFVTKEHYGKFEGRVLDFSDERSFFLREP